MPKRLVAISDLHLSAQELEDFDADIEVKFGEFLSTLGSSSDGVELVIHGDFLDFAQAPPSEGDALEALSSSEGVPLCFTESQSMEKLDAIYRAHPRAFDALRGFLDANPAHTLTLLPGNHDADLFWGGVRTSLRQRVGGSASDRFRIHLQRVYRPASFPGVWVEHGHQFDPINSFFVGPVECWSETQPPILKDKRGRLRLLECLGTRFLVRFLNRLDRDYPYVDNVKPFSVFVRLFAASALVSGYASLRVAMSMWRLVSYLARTGMTSPSDLLSVDGEALDVNSAMVDRLREVNERSKTLQDRVHREGFQPHLPLSLVLDDPRQSEELMGFLSEHLDLLEGLDPDETGYLSTSGDAGTLSLARGFRVDESKLLLAGARKILTTQSDVKVVIMGHTHEPQHRPEGMAYFNTGSWTRYYDSTGTDKLRAWSLLKASAANQFPYALKYVEVTEGAVEQAKLLNHAVNP